MDESHVSLVRGDVPFRLQRALGLIPPDRFGVVRRALLLAVITWLPIVVWAGVRHRMLPGAVAEPLLQHFGIHVRCLVAIPLFVLAEAVAHGVTTRLVPYFLRSGLVRERDRASFVGAVRDLVALRDSSRPWVVIVALVLAVTFVAPVVEDAHEVLWASGEPARGLGFGGLWFLYVARPVYFALLLGWVWRVALVALLMRRVARLELALVPTHPDRAAGLGFLERLPSAFSLVVLGCSAVIASRWAHEVVYHGVHVVDLRMPALALLVVVLIVFLSPLLVFVPKLARTKRQAVLEYGALVGRHGRLVRGRWITHEAVDDPELLSAPEIGPVADTLSLYDAVQKMRVAPLGMSSVLSVLVPVLVPLLLVASIEIPVKDVLLKLVATLA
ncbi:MAG: hypothetical protein AB1689_27225 [Thermodesulfobacteriota bacterium]